MFKQLALVLILVLTLAVGSAFAAIDGQECTLKQNAKVIQVLGGNMLRGVIVPADIQISIGPEISEGMASSFNAMPMNEGMDWTGGNLGKIDVDFGDGNGPLPVMIVIKKEDVKDCK